MNDSMAKTTGKCATTSSIALVFLAVTLISTRSGWAGSQDEKKVETIKVQVKIETKEVAAPVAKKEVVKEAVATKEAAATKPAVAKDVDIKEAAPAPAQVVVGVEGAVMVANPVNNQEALTEQFLQQFHSILATELRVFSSACNPSPVQRREVAIEGGKALRKAAAKMAEVQQGMMNGRGANDVPDPHKIARDTILAASKTRLTPEQLKRYSDEIESREKDRREAVMLNLVASLDQLLILDPDQRLKLCDQLSSNWNENEYPTVDTVVMYEGYFPMIPNAQIHPILNDDQKKIWNNAMKIQFSSIRNFAFFNGVQMGEVAGENGKDEDPDVNAAFAPEVKK